MLETYESQSLDSWKSS